MPTIKILNNTLQAIEGSTIQTDNDISYNYNAGVHYFYSKNGYNLIFPHSQLTALYLGGSLITIDPDPFVNAEQIADYIYVNSGGGGGGGEPLFLAFYNARVLQTAGLQTTFDWAEATMFDKVNGISVDADLRYLYDEVGELAIGYNTTDRKLYGNRGSGNVAYDWERCMIYDSVGNNSVDTDNRTLINSSGNIIANWETGFGFMSGTGIVGSITRVATVAGSDILTLEQSHIRDDASSTYLEIDNESAYLSLAVQNSLKGDVAGFQAEPTYARIYQQGALFELVGQEAYLKTTLVPLGTAGVIGIDTASQLFTTTAGLNPDGSDIGATAQVQQFTEGVKLDYIEALTSPLYINSDWINMYSTAYGNGYFDANASTGGNLILRLGDFAGDYNGTNISIDDNSALITINSVNGTSFNQPVSVGSLWQDSLFLGGSVVDVANSILKDASNLDSIDWNSRFAYASDGTTRTIRYESLGAAIADATNATDVITQLNTLLSQIRTVAPFITQ